MDTTGYLMMSQKEIDRLQVIEKLSHKALTQIEAARQLGISSRQVRRLQRKYHVLGAKGLVSARRGRISQNKLPNKLKNKVLKLINTKYPDFGPTLAHEKLMELHHFKLSVETLRKWMIEAKIWKGKKRKALKYHPMRERRPAYGELIQIDGSPHAWFEERGPYCTLLVSIDDATSALMSLRFEPQETTKGYFALLRDYVERYGRPLALYSDKHTIFRMHLREVGKAITQFGRAMKELDIELICANTPQAKGRVEKANSTLQDRLVKELRLQKINDIDSANIFLPHFVKDYNKRFAKAPLEPMDAHRKELPDPITLNLLFSVQALRKVSKNLELSYKNIIYQIQNMGKGNRLQLATVTVCEQANKVSLVYQGKILKYKILKERTRPAEVVDSKDINLTVERKKQAPPPNHPWRRSYQLSQTTPLSSCGTAVT